MNKILTPLEQTASTKQLLLFILISYVFSIAVRMIWVYQFQDNPQFMWNGQLMINTNDGYFFAEGARDMLAGLSFDSTVNGALATPTALIAKYLPFTFESVILYMPAFFGSLLVIPLVLIGHAIKQPYVGFIAALIGSITWSYYNRTMVGYYDSDMLNIVMPMMVLWSLIFSIEQQRNRYLILVVLLLVLSEWWYPKNIALNTAMVFMALVYSVVFHRTRLFNYKLLIFSLVGLAIIPVYIKLLLAIGLFGLFHYMTRLDRITVIPVLIATIILFVYSGALAPILSSINLYIINRLFADEMPQLLFYDVIKTVREAGAIPFETFSNRIIGSVLGFIFASIGLLIMFVRYPIMIISLPMIAMGFMAYKAGLRFTVYAVPIYALGAGFFIVMLGQYLEAFMEEKAKTKSKALLITVLTLLFLYPNITHIIGYKVPTVLLKSEVEALDRLRHLSDRQDYVVTWWDYGYPIRYYSDTNTLIDGGKHQNDNFIVSEVLLTTSPLEAARLSRLAVETYVSSGYKTIADTLFKNRKPDQVDVSAYLETLRYGDVQLPEKSRDIYLYLPMRMLDILPTVKMFSNLDLSTGKPISSPFFYSTQHFQDSGSVLNFGNGVALLKQEAKVQIGDQKVPLGEFIRVRYDQNGKLHINRQTITPMSRLSIIYLESYQRFILLDSEYLNSTYIQMYIFENYDKELFEPVILDPLVKIYKLKI